MVDLELAVQAGIEGEWELLEPSAHHAHAEVIQPVELVQVASDYALEEPPTVQRDGQEQRDTETGALTDLHGGASQCPDVPLQARLGRPGAA